MTEHIDLIKRTNFATEDIILFILIKDEDVFSTIKQWPESFKIFIKRLYDENFIIVSHVDNKITGICCWCLLNDEDSNKVNKIRWVLPKNITDGDILYIPMCLGKTSGLKEIFTDMNYRKKAKEILWFSKHKWFRRKLISETV